MAFVKNITVRANQNGGWFDTGLWIGRESSITITATGFVKPWPSWANPGIGPNGTDNFDGGIPLLHQQSKFCSLIGRIGLIGTPFSVGSNYSVTTNPAGSTGRLFLAVNDGVDFSDNVGAFTATVTLPDTVLVSSASLSGTNFVQNSLIDTSLVDTWGVLLTTQTDTPGNPDWRTDPDFKSNLIAALTAIQDKFNSLDLDYTVKQVFGGVEIRNFFLSNAIEAGVVFNGYLMRLTQVSRSNITRNNARGFGRLDSGYYPSDYGLSFPSNRGIQATLIHELGHIL